MKNYLTKFILSLFLVAVSLPLAAQFEGGDGLPTPEGDGAHASPIDMYWFVLAAVAVVIIAFSAKKFKKASV